jgi:hypothetical protein
MQWLVVVQSLFRVLFRMDARRAAGFRIGARPGLSVAAMFALGHGFYQGEAARPL